MRRSILVGAAVVFAVGCSSGNTTTDSKVPEAVTATGESGIAVVGPFEADVGSVPRFEWTAMEGADSYRLVVLGPDGPIWAWEGPATSVNLGGLSEDRPELMPGPVVVAGTSWSVAAFDSSGDVIDVTEPISITDGVAAESGTRATSTTVALAALTARDLPDPCSLIAQEDVDDIFGKPVEAGESRNTPGSGGTISGRGCNWGSLSTLDATIFISTNYLVPLDICDWCEPINGYGDEAWGGTTDLGSGGGSLMIIVGELGIQVQAFGPEVAIDQLETLADSLLAGLP